MPRLYEVSYIDGKYQTLTPLVPEAPGESQAPNGLKAPAPSRQARRALHRGGARPRRGGDCARLLARLPLLQRRRDLPPGAREAEGRDCKGHRRDYRKLRLRRDVARFAFHRRLLADRRPGGRHNAALRQPDSPVAAQPAPGRPLGEAGGLAARPAQERPDLRARSWLAPGCSASSTSTYPRRSCWPPPPWPSSAAGRPSSCTSCWGCPPRPTPT